MFDAITYAAAVNKAKATILPAGGGEGQVLGKDADGNTTWVDNAIAENAIVTSETQPESPATKIWIDEGAEEIEIPTMEDLNREKEWVLKGTIDTGNKDSGVVVDLSGCTELVITGYTDSTSSMNLRGIANGKAYDLIGSVTASGGRSFFAMFEDTGFGIFGNGKYATSTTATAYSGTLTCYMVSDVSVADFTKIYYVVPANITDCNLKIYAR